MKRFHIHSKPEQVNLSREEADNLLNGILDELQLERKVSRPRLLSFRRVALLRYLGRRTALAMCLILFFFLFAPGTVAPVSVSHVSAAPSSDAASVQIRFQVDTLIPVQEVTAQINDNRLKVESDGYQNYQVNVQENGFLLLDVYSATGMHSSHTVEIDGIDDAAPVILDHEVNGDVVIIYIDDPDGVGVDYSSVSAHYADDNTPVDMAWCDTEAGCIAYACPDRAILITIPDQNGNYRVISLTPI